MSIRRWAADRFRRWMHGDAHEDYVRRQAEADLFDRECVEKGRKP